MSFGASSFEEAVHLLKLAPMIHLGWCFLIYSTVYFTPLLLMPKRLMMAPSLGNLKHLGLGLPGWGVGVIEPISTKLKPRLESSL